MRKKKTMSRKMSTVGEVRRMIAGLPDDAELEFLVEEEDGTERVFIPYRFRHRADSIAIDAIDLADIRALQRAHFDPEGGEGGDEGSDN